MRTHASSPFEQSVVPYSSGLSRDMVTIESIVERVRAVHSGPSLTIDEP